MSKTRRVATMVAAAVAALGMATAMATPAAAACKGPRPVTTWLKAVKAHKTTWVTVDWKTGKKICDAKVTVAGRDVEIGYPSNTETYTSFSQSDTLKPHRTDYTAFWVWPDFDATEFAPLKATLSFNTCGAHAVQKSKAFWLTLPVWKNHND